MLDYEPGHLPSGKVDPVRPGEVEMEAIERLMAAHPHLESMMREYDQARQAEYEAEERALAQAGAASLLDLTPEQLQPVRAAAADAQFVLTKQRQRFGTDVLLHVREVEGMTERLHRPFADIQVWAVGDPGEDEEEEAVRGGAAQTAANRRPRFRDRISPQCARCYGRHRPSQPCGSAKRH